MRSADRPGVAARRGSVLVMASACGVMVGNIYICQPLLAEIARQFGVPEHLAGFVTVAAQIGYALGIFLVVPVADIAEPRRLVRAMMSVTALGLLVAAAAPTVLVLILASVVLAAATVVPQILVPLATSLVGPERRGRVIGSLQTGLISGILLSRTISGTLASWSGSWRAPFVLAAVLTIGLALVLPLYLPVQRPALRQLRYSALLRSLPSMFTYSDLRMSAGLGFCVFGAFSAIWATLAFHLASPAFGLGAAAAGLFGIWGAPGALLAPIGGRLADRFGSEKVNAGSLLCAGVSCAVAGVFGQVSILALVVSVNLLDFAMQSGQIANQARIFALGGDIRARLNSVYMVATFGGGAFGSLVGTIVWGYAGWSGVCLLAITLIAVGGILLGAARQYSL